MLQYEGNVGDGGYCIVKREIMMIGVMYVCWSELNALCVQSPWIMTSIVMEFGSVWAASITHFTVLGMSSMSVICARPYPFH